MLLQSPSASVDLSLSFYSSSLDDMPASSIAFLPVPALVKMNAVHLMSRQSRNSVLVASGGEVREPDVGCWWRRATKINKQGRSRVAYRRRRFHQRRGRSSNWSRR